MFICSLQLCGIVREKRSNILEKVSRAEIKAGKKTVFYNCSNCTSKMVFIRKFVEYLY